jgi:predicted nucleic acid-binding protein
MADVVCDASPLICLAQLDHLDILSRFFDSLYTSSAVYKEVITDNPNHVQRRRIEIFLQEYSVQIRESVSPQAIRRHLGLGEQSVISLSLELQCPALMDDRKARNEAREMGITVFSTFDILNAADKLGLLDLSESIKTLAESNIFLARY